MAHELIPYIPKNKFDEVAAEFLDTYFPKALKQPMAVPIYEIAIYDMGLNIKKIKITEDLSILGQVFFTKGIATYYNEDEELYDEIQVTRGTMFIDPDVYIQRNNGCANNTIAHECFHWYKHRTYQMYRYVQGERIARGTKCCTDYDSKNTDFESDENIMEWQANGIAPRILMPKLMFTQKVNEIIEIGGYDADVRSRKCTLKNYVIENAAEYFDVSKVSVGFRLAECGFNFSKYN